MNLAQQQTMVAAVKLLDAGKGAEAGVLLEPLRQQYPMNGHVLYNLGLAYWYQQRHHEAIRLWRSAIGADPTLVPAMVNLGQALVTFGDLRESLRYTQMAARRRPHDPHILANLATVLTNLGEAHDGLAAAEHALSINPDHYRCLCAKLGALAELNRQKETTEVALKILELPEGRNSIDALTCVVSNTSKYSDWEQLEMYTKRLEEAVASPTVDINPMAMAFCFDDPELMGRLALRRKNQPMPARPSRKEGSDRVSIAYLSPDFREHPVAHMLIDVLRQHDRSRFRIVTVGTLPTDMSELSQEIAKHADEHIDLTKLDDGESARLLKDRGIDVLVDLVGSTKWCRPGLLQRRPCPVQVLWLGCPSSTGTAYYDGFLVDDTVAPPGYDKYCTEPLIRLPCCYHPISTGFATPNKNLTRSQAKLPTQGLIVGMLQQPNKIRPPVVDLVAKVVAKHEKAHFWLRVHQDGADAVLKRFAQFGLPRQRVHFAPLFPKRSDYLGIYRLVDVLIDSFPYGGHSTTGEALIQGTPMLTVQGRSIHARVASSMLHELGLASDIQPDFETLAQRLDTLLGDEEQLRTTKQRFANAAERYAEIGPRRLARALEDAYMQLLPA